MSIFIVVIIIVLLSALACYAFISQSIEKRRIQRQRILMTLKTKERNFVHLINGFPPNFLTAELMGLIYRSLIETIEQLSKIEPDVQRHIDDITLYTNQLGVLAKSGAVQRARLDNPNQMKDIRQHLQELLRFISQQEALKTINKVQADSYVDQVKRLSLQMAVDVYIYQAKQAQQAGKFRLGVHFFTLARKLLASENATRGYDKQIAQIDGVIAKLEEKAQISGEPVEPESTKSNEPESKEWEQFKKPEDSWKKKQVYD